MTKFLMIALCFLCESLYCSENKLSESFSAKEFQCHCCHQVIIDDDLLQKLERLRSIAGMPVYINSGYRCIKHNKEIGRSGESYHLSGQAADIHIPGYKPEEVARMARQAGFTGIIIYWSYTHVDVRKGSRP